jgi:hypothetical protein
MRGRRGWLVVSTILPQDPGTKAGVCCVAWVGLAVSPILLQALGMLHQFPIVYN